MQSRGLKLPPGVGRHTDDAPQPFPGEDLDWHSFLSALHVGGGFVVLTLLGQQKASDFVQFRP